MRITKDGQSVQLDPLFEGIARNLRQFGYTDVTKDTVHDSLLIPDDIIGMFARDMLEENGLTLET